MSKFTKIRKKLMTNGRRLSFFVDKHLLRICLAIAVLKIIHSLYIVYQTTVVMFRSNGLSVIFGFMRSVFMLIVAISLVMGLLEQREFYIRCWIIITLTWLTVDVSMRVWDLMTSYTFYWHHIRQFHMLVIEILIECGCTYFIQKQYLEMQD